MLGASSFWGSGLFRVGSKEGVVLVPGSLGDVGVYENRGPPVFKIPKQ